MPALDRPNTSHASPEPPAVPDPLERILRVTRKAWAMGDAGPDVRGEAPPVPPQADKPRTPRDGNRDGGTARRLHLARLAARALAAQIMAMRCRQAFAA